MAYVYDCGDALDIGMFGIDLDQFLIGNEISEIMPNIQSIYSLLPMNTYFSPYLNIKTASGTVTNMVSHAQTINAFKTYLNNWNETMYLSVVENQDRLFINGKHITRYVDSYYIVGDDISTPKTLQILLSADNSSSLKDGDISIIDITNDGDGTVSQHSATINDSVTSRTIYKYSGSNIAADHVGLIKGTDDGKTLNLICDIIRGVNIFSYSNSTFFNKYSAYKKKQ